MTNTLLPLRVKKLWQLLRDTGADALLLSNSLDISYLTGYQGFSPVEREAFVLVIKKQIYLFTDARHSEAIRNTVPHVTLVEITGSMPFSKHLETLIKLKHITTLGYDEHNLTVAEFKKIKPLTKLQPISLRNLRKIKSIDEISSIQKACSIGNSALAELFSNIPRGVREHELARELELLIRKRNANLSFPTIVAFGKNAAVPHHLTGKTKLKKSDIVLIDFGVNYQGYCSDMTRTFFIGEPTNKERTAYETTYLAQQEVISYIKKCLREKKPVTASEVDKIARQVITDAGFPTIPHALGHGIGLAVHESPTLSPRSNDILTEGMVFSIEPGIYLPGQFGIRTEDLFAIQNGKLVQLTRSSVHHTM